MSDVKIFSFDHFQAKREQKQKAAPVSVRSLMSLEVLTPDAPGGKYHGRFLDAYVDPTLDASANLEKYADALEEVAARLRVAARRNAG